MNLQTLILEQNACYKAGRKITPKGIMVHSTGANNPNLKRYVGSDDGKLGTNQYNNHWNTPYPGGSSVCVHAFIGKLADGSVATYQTLPWEMRGWHCGDGAKGSANNTHISIEICEDDLSDAGYFAAVYQEAVELCAYLCKEYGFDPVTQIICHSEGYLQGVSSNHGDVMHWFPKHGKSMDTFRADVAAALEDCTPAPELPPAPQDTKHHVGDIVTVSSYYAASTDPIDKAVFPSQWKTATITRIVPGARNPYLVGDYGWCNDGDIQNSETPPGQNSGASKPGKQQGSNPSIEWDFHYDGQIMELQKILIGKGHNLAADGKAGDKTYEASRKYTVKSGDSGPLTRWVQQRINAMGFACGSADGIAGAKTMQGIGAFQSSNGLGVGYLGGTDWYYVLVG